jgi:spore coat protein U-like protein
MKSRVLLAASAAVLLMPAAGMAAGSHTLNVTAVVDGTCTFDSASSPMDFGTIDPTSAVPATATAAVNFHCSTGTPYTVTLQGAGSYSLTGAVSAASLPYSAAITGGDTGLGAGMTGAAQTVSVGASIAVADFQNANADSYTGTLILDVSP